MKNFKQLKIWQKGFDITIKTFKLTSDFPKEERFGLSSQMTKSAVSIPSNIAEGSSRRSEKDYSRFIEIALGSSYELETQVLIAKAINYGQREMCKELLNDLEQEQKMLIGFSNILSK